MEANVVFDEVAQHSQKEYGMANTIQNPCTDNKGWNQAKAGARDAAANVGEMVAGAANAVGSMAHDAVSSVADNADTLAANAGIEIQQFGEQMSKHSPNSGMMGNVSQRLARSVKEGGAYLEDEKLSGITKQALDIVVKNPIPSVCIAIGLGWLIGRRFGR